MSTPATLEQLRQLVMALERRIAELERRLAADKVPPEQPRGSRPSRRDPVQR